MAERITGHTELIGLMAYPIRHSNSPAMHNEAFATLGLDYAYLAFEVDNDTLEDAIKRIEDGRFQYFHAEQDRCRTVSGRTVTGSADVRRGQHDRK